MKRLLSKCVILGVLAAGMTVFASAQATKARPAKPKSAPKPAASPVLSNEELVHGLKEALSAGVKEAVAKLGRTGGFYNNPRVKIVMTGGLQSVEEALRFSKNDDLVDDLIHSMNRAAEQSVIEGTNVFAGAISQLTVEDAKAILAGEKDAATQYFRRLAEQKMLAEFLPIVKTSTEELGVTAGYRMVVSINGGGGDFDIDKYVTQKTLDGLFLLIADEEKRIRDNPAARTTAILKKVFGSVAK